MEELIRNSLDDNEFIINKANTAANRRRGEIFSNFIVSDGIIAKIYFNNNAGEKYTIIDADKDLIDYIIRNYTITYDLVNKEAISNSDGNMLSLHQIVLRFYGNRDTNGIMIHHKNGDRLDNRLDNLEIKKC